jgi:hypothetical protein
MMHASKLNTWTKWNKCIEVRKSKKKGKDTTSQRSPKTTLQSPRDALNRAIPTLLLKHQSLYMWKPTIEGVCVYYKVAWKGGICRITWPVPWLAEAFMWKCTVRQPPHGWPTMTCGQTNLVKLAPRCCLLESVAIKPWLICAKVGPVGPGGADRTPSGATWLGLGPT